MVSIYKCDNPKMETTYREKITLFINKLDIDK